MRLIRGLNINQLYFKVPFRNSAMPGIRKEEGPHKYNKVNQQKKFHLLTLFYKHKMSLK